MCWYRGLGAVKRWVAGARVQKLLGLVMAFLRGFILSAGGLRGQIMPLGLGMLLHNGGLQALVMALGSSLGFWLFWGKAGHQGMAWSGVGLVCAWLMGRKPHSLPLVGSVGAFIVSAAGLLFQLLWKDDTTIPIYLLRIGVGLASAVVWNLYRQRNMPWAGWVIQGMGVLALAQVDAWGLALAGTVVWMGQFARQRAVRQDSVQIQQMENLAVALEGMRQQLLEVPLPPIDESVLTSKVRERACGGCPSRKTCLQRLDPVPEELLHRPLFDTIALPFPCKRPGRMILELRRAQEQLRSLRAERERLGEYRWAMQQQYQVLSHVLRQGGTSTANRCRYRPEVAVRAMGRGEGNGDRCLWFDGTGNRYYVLLCDGMGTGLGASQEGRMGAELLRQLLQAGCSPEDALQSLNSLLALCGKAGAVTVDLAQLELDVGRATVYKWGAAPSWLLREGKGEKIGTATPPPGLSVMDGRETVTRLSLRRGEKLILLSDGVVFGDLSGAESDSLGALAAEILDEGWHGMDDDATVAVIRLHGAATPIS